MTPLLPALDRAIETLRPGGRFAIMSFAEPRPPAGPLRWLYPACRLAARCVDIDDSEVLDGRKVAAKWRNATAHLLYRF